MTYRLTEEQLKALLQDAVENAVQSALAKVVEIAEPVEDNSETKKNVHEDSQAPVTHTASIPVTEFSEQQYADAMATMAANRGQDDQPKVGIFWYNRGQNELFGVVSRKTTDFSHANARGGLITCTEMHEDIWKKEFRRQKYHGGEGPYVGAYENKPRGRVFYSIDTNEYIIAVGHWIHEYPDAIALIMSEYNLPADKTRVQVAGHWDIGQRWM